MPTVRIKMMVERRHMKLQSNSNQGHARLEVRANDSWIAIVIRADESLSGCK
jgi:hypothetical protein